MYLKPLIEELLITLNEEEKSKEIANKIVILASEKDGYQYTIYITFNKRLYFIIDVIYVKNWINIHQNIKI